MAERFCPYDKAVLRLAYRAADGFSYHVCTKCGKTFAGLMQSWRES